MNKRSLGKGHFDTVLELGTVASTEKEEPINTGLLEVGIDLLTPNSYQPRLFDTVDCELKELAVSIKEQGIIQPVIVRQSGEGYEIVAGERRWRAAKLAGLLCVPVIVRDIPDEYAAAFALIENLQRKDLNPVEEALGYKKLTTDFSLTHEQIAKRVGKSRTSVTNTLRLLNLDEGVKLLLKEEQLSMGQVRPLLSLPMDMQLAVARKIAEQQLNSREVEKLVSKILTRKEGQEEPVLEFATRADNWAKQLTETLHSCVKVHINNQGKGRVVVHFDSIEEGDWLMNKLNVKD